MRILVIAEDPPIDSINALFNAQGEYEIISYKILLKALDNVSEIKPAIIIINAADFPRHWKVALQFICATCADLHYKIALIVDEKFDDDERKKSAQLDVEKIVTESELITYTGKIAGGLSAGKLANVPVGKIADVQCMFQNPTTGIIETGIVESIKEKELLFCPDADSAKAIPIGSLLSVSLKTSGAVKSVPAQIVSNGNVLKIQLNAKTSEVFL